MKKKTNIVNDEYLVQIYHNIDMIASNSFINKTDAQTSASRIAKMLKNQNPEECTYAMIWQGKQMIDYIEY